MAAAARQAQRDAIRASQQAHEAAVRASRQAWKAQQAARARAQAGDAARARSTRLPAERARAEVARPWYERAAEAVNKFAYETARGFIDTAAEWKLEQSQARKDAEVRAMLPRGSGMRTIYESGNPEQRAAMYEIGVAQKRGSALWETQRVFGR